jgi:hypothetical protein
MDDLKSRLDALNLPVFYETVPGNGHQITDLAGENSFRVFDLIRD